MSAASTNSTGRHLSPCSQAIITTCYLLGISANALALITLCQRSTRPSNQKHRMMLKCLTANDLTAMLGMLVLMYLQLYLPVANSQFFCGVRVIWRVFGLGSGCVTVVMAVERYLAITKPFLYQKQVTTVLLRRSIFILWILAVLLVCMPLFGFGLYYRHESGKSGECVRYRNAVEEHDVAYAYLYFGAGILLCLCIAFCNVAVMLSLWFKSNQNAYGYCYPGDICNGRKPVYMRRSISKMSTNSTREEVAFGRLMGLLCVIFIICWMPQLITIPMTQMDPTKPTTTIFYRVADVLMALHFFLDPCVYVIQRLPAIRRLLSIAKPDLNRSANGSIRIMSSDTPIYFSKV